jgi:tetratricopeptide (TPR) repeat protein
VYFKAALMAQSLDLEPLFTLYPIPPSSYAHVMESSDSPAVDPSKAGPSRRQELEHRLRDVHTDRDAYLELAAIYRSENRPQLAAKVLQKGHEVFPEDASILWEWEEARLARSLQQLAEVREMAAKTKSVLADNEYERGQTNWATCRIQVCRARIQRDESKAYLRLVLAEALYDLERYDEALDEVTPLENDEHHGATAALWQGRCHLILGHDVKAMKYLRNACLRRAIVSPPRVRAAALKLLIDLADRHGLTATQQLYQTTLASIGESETPAKAANA